MTKNYIDYSNTIIYKIFCKDSTITELYVGHTTNFVQKKHTHKQCCIDNTSKKLYKLNNFIRNNGGWINWKMEIIECFNCTSQYEAIQKEHEYCILLKATLNNPEQLLLKKIIQSPIKPQIQNNYKYCCNQCKYNTNFKKDYIKHLLTPKHIRESSIEVHDPTIVSNPNIINYIVIPHQESTNIESHHNARDDSINEDDESPLFTSQENEINTFVSNDCINGTNNEPQINEMMYKLFEMFFAKMTKSMTESNQELKQTILDQQATITELANKPSIVNNTNNGTINTTVFLNVNCKDAMTLNSYLNVIKVEPAHIFLMLKEGSCAGFCEILKSSMNKIKITDRPIHCTDAKRNAHWVKHETGWEKENENKSIKRVCDRIKYESGQTAMAIIHADPEYRIMNTDKNETMIQLMTAAVGGNVSGGQNAIDATIIKYAEEKVINLTKDKMTQAIKNDGP